MDTECSICHQKITILNFFLGTQNVPFESDFGVAAEEVVARYFK
jgi:hypothetical protein|tara:strand:+ start:426 stop:557 length:132 start_codon:yes stop_codon:yes gene_type:complete